MFKVFIIILICNNTATMLGSHRSISNAVTNDHFTDCFKALPELNQCSYKGHFHEADTQDACFKYRFC